jgi:hypothetical protein
MIPKIKLKIDPKSDTLICSLASGEAYIDMLNIMGKTLSHYADLHGMDCFLYGLVKGRLVKSRPPVWDKIVFLNHMLNYYDTVIWVDCDAIICNPEADIRHSLTGEYPMYVVYQEWGNIPNTGVMVLKRSPKTAEILEGIWKNKGFISHKWWEQAALMDLMGYTFTSEDNPHELEFNPTPICQYIGSLDRKWNSCCSNIEETIIKHYCGTRNQDVVTLLNADYDHFYKDQEIQANVLKMHTRIE